MVFFFFFRVSGAGAVEPSSFLLFSSLQCIYGYRGRESRRKGEKRKSKRGRCWSDIALDVFLFRFLFFGPFFWPCIYLFFFSIELAVMKHSKLHGRVGEGCVHIHEFSSCSRVGPAVRNRGRKRKKKKGRGVPRIDGMVKAVVEYRRTCMLTRQAREM